MPQSITQPFDDLQIRAHSTICAEFVLRGNGIQLRNRLSESTYDYLNKTGTRMKNNCVSILFVAVMVHLIATPYAYLPTRSRLLS